MDLWNNGIQMRSTHLEDVAEFFQSKGVNSSFFSRPLAIYLFCLIEFLHLYLAC